MAQQTNTIPFATLKSMSVPLTKAEPLSPFMKPPSVIPLNSLPPSVAPMFNPINQSLTFSLPGSSAVPTMGGGQMPAIRSWPLGGSLPQRQKDSEHLFMNGIFAGGLRPIQLRSPSPEDKDDMKDDDLHPENSDRSNRRREMNRLAQQKSRLRKDQLRASLQCENDALKAKIISLEAEVRVWKNMTKKSENDANELRRKLEEMEAKTGIMGTNAEEEQNENNEGDAADSTDELRIVEEIEENEEDVEEKKTEEAREAQPMEENSEVVVEEDKDKKYEDLQKEIELLTNEIQRMYHLSSRQAEAQKMLHQALEDQQQRIKLYENRKNEKVSSLEICATQTESVAPVSKAGIRWRRRTTSRGISKRDIEKTITKILIKNKKGE